MTGQDRADQWIEMDGITQYWKVLGTGVGRKEKVLTILTLLISHCLKYQHVPLGALVIFNVSRSSNTCDNGKPPLIENPARSGHTTLYICIWACNLQALEWSRKRFAPSQPREVFDNSTYYIPCDTILLLRNGVVFEEMRLPEVGTCLLGT